MRKYGIDDENKIRVARLVREWTRSGLLDKSQMGRMLPDLNVDFRRTNPFLRMILFGFTLVIIAAVVFLVADIFRIREDHGMAGLSFVSALVCILLAEHLAGEYGLYRFGVEEGAAAASIILAGIAGFVGTSRLHGWQYELPQFVGLLMAAAAGLAVYLRFRFRYAIVASLICLSMAAFETPASEEIQRLASAVILACIFVVVRFKRARQEGELVAEEYGFVQTAAWLGVYVWLNVLLPWGYVSFDRYSTAFHVFSYAMIWILPVLGLGMAIRGKDRWMLDVNLLLALATLATNKTYLGLERHSWDPILLGVLLIGTAVGMRRWLASADRRGFTPLRILSSDERRMSMVATASGMLNPMKAHTANSPDPDKFESGGGRSGGAGATGTF